MRNLRAILAGGAVAAAAWGVSSTIAAPMTVRPEAAEIPLTKAADSKKRDLQLCLALRRCRNDYTRCYNRLEKEVHPDKWSEERAKCVATYKGCIRKNFKGGEMLFTRWFVPDENCEQYR